MSAKKILRTILTLFVTTVLSGLTFAQSNGSISGTVKDKDSGVIVGAAITASNPALGVLQTTETNATGNFLFPQIPPGTYTLSVEKQGFKKTEKSNVVLSVASKVFVGDIILQVGSVSEVVSVQAEVGQLQIQTESGERSSVVTNRQLRDIALNGRNIVDLMKTVPGVIAGGTQTTSTVNNVVGSFTVNGTRSLQHEYTVDGVTNLNLGNNTGALVTVNPDAVDEVKVLTSNYQAEYGRAGGGYIGLITRSGTDDYHGGARYFRRHDSMNANTFFNNNRGGDAKGFPRPLYRFNYYGWDFGGPVIIPHVVNGRHKLFFFISQEYYRQLIPQQNSVNIRVPTALERSGDFSQTLDGNGTPIRVLMPGTTTQFPGNVIPPGSIYGPGQAILNFLPLPNTTAGGNKYNYTSQVSSSYPRSETILRGDWQIDASTRLSLRWIHNNDDQQFAYGTTTASWNWPLAVTDRKNGPGNVSTLSLTKNFGPTWVNELFFGSGRGGVTIAPSSNKASRATAGINTPLLFPNANESGLIPSLAFNGIAGIPVPAGSSLNGAANTSIFGTFDQRFTIWQVTDNLSKIYGPHVFKFGFYYQSASNASNSQTHVESDIDFTSTTSNPLNSGYPFANALLGVYTAYTQSNIKPHVDSLYHDVSWYLQDTWKIHPRLTLDLGVRFSYYQPVFNNNGGAAYFDPSLFNASQAQVLYRPVCVGAYPCSSSSASYLAFDPRQSGSPTMANTLPGFNVGKIVPGSGAANDGIVLTTADKSYPAGGIKTDLILPQPRIGFAWDVTGSHNTVVRGGFGVTYDRPESGATGFGPTNPPLVITPALSNGFLQNITPGQGALSPLALSATDRISHFPTVYSYSLGVQRNLGAGTTIDVSYVGTQSRHNLRRFNLNAPAYGSTFTAAAQDPTQFAAGPIPASEPGLPAEYVAAGVPFSGARALSADFLRPYQGYGDITYIRTDGNSTYHSLQVSVNRRFSKGITFGANYLFSKVRTTVSDDTAYTNIVNPRKFDYALANFDRTHYFVANFVWDLPKASRFVGGSTAAHIVFDNWTLSGITWLSTGSPTEVGLTISGVDAGARLLGTPTSGNLSGEQPRFLLIGKPQSGSTINPAAFAIPGIGQIGPYPRMYLRNPGIENQDLSVFKNFLFGGEGRRYLQLRLEAFNVFNHPQFSGYNLTTSVTNAAGQTGNLIFTNFTGLTATTNLRPASGPNSLLPLGNYFGERTTARDPRILQLAAKFYF